MTAACPSCFTRLRDDEARFRCNSGQCAPEPDQTATAMGGFALHQRPTYAWTRTDAQPSIPPWMQCRRCQGYANVQVCPACHRDLPEGWRDRRVFTMAITGARGAGKSVYIAVLVESLIRYLQERGRTIVPYTTGTKTTYIDRYHRPLFQENRVLEGTPTVESGGAYQRDPLIWQITGGTEGELFLVIRDVAGEDIENVAPQARFLSYMDRADLLVFLFDSLRLPSMTQILAGLIPEIDARRMGMSAAQVLPVVMNQLVSGHTDIALAFSKFDAFHELPKADTEPYARIMANPSAHFNRDETQHRPLDPHAAREHFGHDSLFLDQEVRSLFRMIREESVTLQADQAAESGRARSVRHFAVSAVGETPQHVDQLTERGISPFRVLDPLLWGLYQREILL